MSIKTDPHSLCLFFCKLSALTLVLIVSFGLVQGQRLMDDFKPIIKGYPIIYSSALDHEGNLYVAGLLGIVGSETTSTLVRIHPNGSLDPTFNAPIDLHYFTTDIIISPDSVLLCLNDRRLLVLKKDGAIEESFKPDNSFFDVFAAAIAGDKYIVGARAKSNGDSKIFRLNRNGSIDYSFEEITLGELPFNTKIKVLSDGKILIAGKINTFNTIEVGGVIRLNDNGTLDETFDNGMILNGSVEELEIQPDGKIILAGTFTTFNNVDTHGIIRLTEDGIIDPDFDLSATENAFVFYALQVDIKENGKILVGGYSRDGSYQGFYKIIQLNSDGSLDDLFNPTIIERAANGLSFSMHGGSDGVVYASGNINGASGEIRIGVIAFDEAGTILEFNPKIGNVPSISDVVRQNDGKIIITGEFHQINDAQVYGIARINTDGSLDQSFQASIDFSDPRANQAYEVELQSDGKIILAGLLHNIDNSNSNQHQIIRLHSDGTIDDSFSAIRTEFKISDLSVNEFDEIFVTGRFSSVNYENTRNGLAKFSSSGSFISEFNSSNFLPSGSTTSSIKLLSNHEILIGGFLEDLSKGYVYRVDANGNLVSSIAEEDLDYNLIHFVDSMDDLIFFGGQLSSGGGSNTKIPLYITDQFGSNLNDTAVQISDKYLGAAFFGILKISDNDILVGGSFTEINDIEKSGLAKVTLTGAVDEEFTFNSFGLKDWGGRINHILREDNETALVFGSLSKINEEPLFGAARIKFLNDVPVIDGTNSILSTYEDLPIEISLLNLTVTDEDNSFPEGFTMIIQEGEGYTLSEGIITPTKDFFGTLTVLVTVSDGKDESEPYEISIEVTPVNDKPVISGFIDIPSVNEGETFSLSLSNFAVTDPDNTFPDDFSLILEAGVNYTLDGLRVVPAADFNGKLIVKAKVNDGELNSDVFEFEINVLSTNEAPVITAYTGMLSTQEDSSLTIDLLEFSITDSDNTFPDDFTLVIENGDNYTVSGSIITPFKDFNGTLAVSVKVNDSEVNSPSYELVVEVAPVNDPPLVQAYIGMTTSNEDVPLSFSLNNFLVVDPDNTFPEHFTLILKNGENYLVEGNSIVPTQDYFGQLFVSAIVNDGTSNSAAYQIEVDIIPIEDQAVVTGYSGPTSTLEETALEIDLLSLSVMDPDNSFPEDFSLEISENSNYTISGFEIVPTRDFNGTITVPVAVKTVDNISEFFDVTIEVAPVNDIPVIDGYLGDLQMEENSVKEISINDFVVTDPDNAFPDQHSLVISPGNNYAINGNAIMPTPDFIGNLTIPVSISDGLSTSEPTVLTISVSEVTSVSELSKSIRVFPVPVKDELMLNIDNGLYGDVDIVLVDIVGNTSLKKTIRKTAYTLDSVIDLRSINRGTFVLYIKLPGHEPVSRRIIIK